MKQILISTFFLLTANMVNAQCVSCPSFDFSITPTNAWQINSSSITAYGCEFYQVAVDSGFKYIFKTGCGDGATANFDTYLELYDAACIMITKNDDGCGWVAGYGLSTITWPATYTGYAYLKVRDYDTGSGNYILAYQSCNAVSFFTYSMPGNTAIFTDASTGGITNWYWDFGDGTTSTLQYPNHVFTCGVYNVTLLVTNLSGCTSSYSEWIDARFISTMSVSITTSNVSCASNSDGAAAVVVTSGTPPYSFMWSNGQNNATANSLVQGNYLLTVTGSNNCAVIDTVQISANAGPWKIKANFGGFARESAIGFSIGNKGYIGTGWDNSDHQDFWEWNQATNVWTQKADFGGTARDQAVGFSIGTKGYIGTGWDVLGTPLQDFWEWDGDIASPTYNSWIQKANFGGTARHGSVGFSIGSKGYIGTGNDGASYKKDFWEYDPATDIWTPKANFGGGEREAAVGFSIGSKGYIGTGWNGNEYQDFWEWNQATNTWTQKAPFAGTARDRAVGFSIGSIGYIGTGWDINGNYIQDFWQYDVTSNSWTQKTNFSGTYRRGATGFSIGTKGYVGTGWDGNYQQDFWEYDPSWMDIAIDSSTVTDVGCGQYNNGGIALSISGGTPPYAYLWSDGQTTSVATNLIQGTYSVTLITDANLCPFSSSAAISVSNATGPWALKSAFAGTARQNAVGFSIGTKGYIGTGVDVNGSYQQDFWEWDQATNVWTQKAPFGGGVRGYAVGFSIGTKGYVGTGYNGWSFEKDLWEYNPSTNMWTQKSDFGGTARYGAVGFSIGTKGYIGTGDDGNGFKKDLWEYNPNVGQGGTWVPKANFGGSARLYAVGFSISNKGYIGTGQGVNFNYKNDFWEWNQATNIWTQKTDFGGTARTAAVGFSIGTKGYIGTGVDSTSNIQDFWEWNQATNAWEQKTDFGGTARNGAVGFSIGTKGFIGTGYDNNMGVQQDFWQYNPSEDITVTVLNPVSCYGGSNGAAFATIPSGVNSPYTYLWDNGLTTSAASNLTAGTHSVTITDAKGCPRTGTVLISQAVAALTSYTITTTPSACSPPNGTATEITIGGALPYSYLWSNGQTTKTATGLSAANYNVTITDAWGCTTVGWTTIPALSNPSVYILSYSHVSCYGLCDGLATANASGGSPPYSYIWNTLPIQTTATATGLCAGVHSLTVKDNQGCINSIPASATIQQAAPLIASISVSPATCGNTDGSISSYTSGGIAPYTYLWSSGATSQTASALSNGNYSVTITDNNGCTASFADTVNLYTAVVPVCLVTVDSTSTKNMMVWEKPTSQGSLAWFRIYREFGLNNYVKIDSVPYSSVSTYTDNTLGVNPKIQSYRYKISVVDNCGHESFISQHHRTIHLATPQFTPPGTFDLIWTNDYEGFSILGYNVLRYNYNTINWDSIGFVTYGNLSYTDLNSPSDSSLYMIEAAVPAGGCIPSIKNPVPMAKVKSTRSNTSEKTMNGNGIHEYENAWQVNVYPNPNKGEFTIDLKTTAKPTHTNVKIYDVLGQLMYAETFTEKNPKINSALSQGIYQLEVETDSGRMSKKIIIQ